MIPSTKYRITFCKSFFNFLLLLIACPCHTFSRLFMKIVHGVCGHIKARWDNHQSCLSCPSCCRLSTCSSCSHWSESVWVLSDKKIHATRKSVMTKKRHNKKKQIAETKYQMHLRTILLMGALPHRAILPGVRPIWVVTLWVRRAPRVEVDQAPVNQSLVNQSPGNFFTGQPVTC